MSNLFQMTPNFQHIKTESQMTPNFQHTITETFCPREDTPFILKSNQIYLLFESPLSDANHLYHM